MAKDEPSAAKRSAEAVQGKKPAAQPDWANGLRQLYDQVVEEPLPDSFKDLLAKLDDTAV
ncbi:NepR family anti-sigma factor [Altererythrobacter sp. ZODW24]|uniref:NepR family anti-sigma factor n=1 Tax=Altererythrobacter sp. ZODW24 TaxID=2185142 RepID=UPI000DF7DFA7|nr:NepR family anti-sigma factor [Altererythrobacter sp. ZODW24]